MAENLTSPLETLTAGNRRYVEGAAKRPHQDPARRVEVASGQEPFAVVITCADSRVTPEIIFDCGLGDIFVIRSAGHVLDDAMIGTIEYAAEHLHVPLVVVVGHSSCGAVKAAVDSGLHPGAINMLLQYIAPAVEVARQQPGDLMDNAVRENTRMTVARLRQSEPILAHLVEQGHLTIVGVIYDLHSGRIAPIGD